VQKRGFDGLFLDNVDMIENHPHQRRGMYRLVRNLSRRVHAAGKLLFRAKRRRGDPPVASSLDGWNREDVTLGDVSKAAAMPSRPPEETARALAGWPRLPHRGSWSRPPITWASTTRGWKRRLCIMHARSARCLSIADIGLTTLPVAPLRCADAE
jgi:hypothetical protein